MLPRTWHRFAVCQNVSETTLLPCPSQSKTVADRYRCSFKASSRSLADFSRSNAGSFSLDRKVRTSRDRLCLVRISRERREWNCQLADSRRDRTSRQVVAGNERSADSVTIRYFVIFRSAFPARAPVGTPSCTAGVPLTRTNLTPVA